MATDNQTESGQTGTQDLPTPEFSEQATSSTSSGADEIVNKLLPHLEQMIEKKVQSVKDKRFSEIEKVLGGRSKLLAELEEAGVPITKEVRAEMRIRELEERLTQPNNQPAQERVDGSTQTRTAATDAIAELKKYELSPNDPEFLALLRGKYQNRAEFDLAVSRHVVGKLAPQKPPNPADVVQSPATSPSTGKLSEAAADQKYAELGALLRSPTANATKIANLKKELNDSGYAT